MSFPRRGEIYWVDLDPTVGSEISKIRPAAIISNDVGNEYSPRVIVAPITSQRIDRVAPYEVRVPAGEANLRETSKVLLNQIRTSDKRRIQAYIGTLPGHRILEVDRAIRLSLAV